MIQIQFVLLVMWWLELACSVRAAVPEGYLGKPFSDAYHRSGVPAIPGVVQCALYDLGGEGVAYHDTDPLNNGSGKLNLQPGHQRAHAGEYMWHFRKEEGVDLSFVKDWADLNHTTLVGHHWNLAPIGTIHFPEPGLQLLTFHYGKGNNFAYFEFEPAEPLSPGKP